MAERGLVESDGSFTLAGAAQRAEIEALTDVLAVRPYRAIGEDGCRKLRELARPFSRGVVNAGLLPG
jgi:hypothetical protein